MRLAQRLGEKAVMHIRKPSVAGIVAVLALFVTLGGSAVAASHYLITKTSQIKPSVLSKLKGSAGATGATGAAGAVGPQGSGGPQGPAGPSNLSALTTVVGGTVEVASGTVGSAQAICPAGTRAVSGGGFGSIAGLADSEMETSHTSWFIIVANSTGITLKIHATAECAGAGQAVAASVKRPTGARIAERTAELEAALAAKG